MPAHSIFVSYSHKDEKWKDLLLAELEPLVGNSQIVAWHDRLIAPGEEWYEAIQDAMARATLAVCLLSPDFLVSDFCTKEEIGYLLDRRQRDGLRLVPVLVRECGWRSVPWMSALQQLPRDARAIADAFAGREGEALADVSRALTAVLNDPAYQPAPAAPVDWPALDEKQIYLDRMPSTGRELFGRTPQLHNLDLAWRSPAIRVVVLAGRGGVGKTTLVSKWLERMQADNYRGASRVFGWSFHSQGLAERVTSAHEFIIEALQWFGDPDPASGSPWDQAERLVRLIRGERVLLVLDGLEPLQSESEAERGRITDPALATLLSDLAFEQRGLCVVTTRDPVRDLADVPDMASHENLEQVSVDAGRAILRVGRVVGSDRALETLASEFGCDALALKLLAAYLRGTDKRDARNAAAVPPIEMAEEEPGRNARRVLSAFAQRYAGRAELEALYMLALFDRPAPANELCAVRSAPAIPNLTDRLATLGDYQWKQLLGSLQNQDLVAFDDAEGDIDTHPIVRAHFAAELRQRFPAAYREGHDRVYEFLKTSSEDRPATVAAMMPLVRAVGHAREAERWREAAVEVYFSRIQRQREDYAIVQLGAPGPALSALAALFTSRWREPVPLVLPKQAYLLSQAAGCLKQLGRFGEALEASVNACRIDRLIAAAAPETTGSAATYMLAMGQDLNAIAELYLVTGPISMAGMTAQEALKAVSETITSRFWVVVILTTVAEAYHRLNCVDQARETFQLAETIHRELGRKLPALYARQGFRYCNFLLDQGQADEVVARASDAVAVTDNWPIDTALDHLSLGRAYLALGDLSSAEGHLQATVDGTRYAGESKLIADTLLARGELRWATGARNDGATDVDRSIRIARWQGARLAECDGRLLRARMRMEAGEPDRARRDLDRARELIEATDYRVREGVLRGLEQLE